jgi:hypothetical protein
MKIEELKKIVTYLVKQGLDAIKNNTDENQAIIDYVSIFSKDDDEFKNLELVAETMGVQVDKENIKTGKTYLLNEPIKTAAGELKLLKIRIPDATRPQRGAPDFKIPDYVLFKEKYLQTSGNFTLMTRKDYEMIEIKGVDVLVYVPSKTLSERM